MHIKADGRAHVVVFLAHWCPHCNREAPRLRHFLATHPIADDVVFTLVAAGSDPSAPGWPPSRWFEANGLDGVPVIADSEDQAASQALGLDAYPFVLVLDRDHRVVGRFSGEQSEGFFAEVVDAVHR